MGVNLLLFAASLGILILASDKFIHLARLVSGKLRISPLVIGATLVALGTSMPELAVSVTAALRNDPGLAMGNIAGSNILNICLIFPLGILRGKIKVGTTKTIRNGIIMVITTFLFLGVNKYVDNNMGSWILLLGAGLFTIVEIYWGITGRDHEDQTQIKTSAKKFVTSDAILLGLSLLGIIAGGLGMVSSVENIANITKISTTTLGLTVTALATSMPELLSTLFSQNMKQDKLTIGNLLGSNIYNLLLIGGLLMIFGENDQVSLPVSGFLIISAMLMFTTIVMNKGKVIAKNWGWLYAAGLLGYMFFL